MGSLEKVCIGMALGALLAPVPLVLYADQESSGTVLEEIVVTAQKRAQSLQDIPIAMNAYDATAIENMGLNSAKDIGQVAPALQMPTYPTSSNNLALFIRGIGNADSISMTKDNTVGVYYDGVYAGRSSGLLADLADLQRVEILRGPQGTLYGRNTTSGAINFINAQPTGEFGFKQKITLGNLGTRRSVTTMELPAMGDLAVKLTAALTDRDGWVKNNGANKVDGGKYEDYYAESKQGYRVALRYDGIDKLLVNYAFDTADMDTASPYFQYAGPIGGIDAGYNPITNSFSERLEVTRTPTGGGEHAYYLPQTVTQVDGHNLSLAYHFSDSVLFKSITGLRQIDDNSSTNFSQSFGSAGNIEINTLTDHEQFSQEFQVLGDVNRWHYVAGLYYLKETSTQTEHQYLDRQTVDNTGIYALDLTSLGGPTPCSIFGQGGNGAGSLAPACAAPFTATYPLFLGSYAMASSVKSTAVFGQAAWLPEGWDDDLELTVGLRYTKDQRASARTNDSWAFNGFAPGGTESDIGRLDWSVIADYHWSDDVSTYLKASTAFRSGGASRNALDYSKGFDKETLISYEFGWKAEFADRRIRLNGAVFQMNINDIILDYLPDPVNSPQFVEVFNSGEATVSGLEVDALGVVTDDFIIGVNYAYLDSSISDAVFPDGTDRTDSTRLVWAPENAYSVTADYTLPVANKSTAVHLDYSWQDKQLALANINFGRVEVPAYGQLNARVSWTDRHAEGGHWSVAVWAKNLLDDDSINYRIGSTAVTRLQPRTVAVDVVFEY